MRVSTTLSDSAIRHTPPDVEEMVVPGVGKRPDPAGPGAFLYQADAARRRRPAQRAPDVNLGCPTPLASRLCAGFAYAAPRGPTRSGPAARTTAVLSPGTCGR